MKLFGKIIVAAAMSAALPVYGQELSGLQPAENITVGTFPNGIHYYLCSNVASRGRADFALVQTACPDTSAARESLIGTLHLDPEAFLARNHVGYGPHGYVQYYGVDRIFRFEDVDIETKETVDSTLLMLLDFMTLCNTEQAVIIAGDINREQYRTALHTLGLMLPAREKADEARNAGTNRGNQAVSQAVDSNAVHLEFHLRNISRKQAGTVTPVVSELFTREFGYMVNGRIRANLKAADIPYWINIGPNTLDVYSDSENLDHAREIVYAVISDIRSGGITAEEFKIAKQAAIPYVVDNGGIRLGDPNRKYVDRCIASYERNMHLASPQTISDFLRNRVMSEEREMQLFDNFCRAALADIDLPVSSGIYTAALDNTSLDSLHNVAAPKKVKLLKETREPVTGGKLLTFADGRKVIVKRIAGSGRFNFGLVHRGGAAALGHLVQGEGIYLNDVLSMTDIAGMEGNRFTASLRANGISVSADGGIETFRIGGSAPSSRVEEAIKTLLKIGYGRTENPQAFDYFKRCDKVRSENAPMDRWAYLDSLVCPDYLYTRTKRNASLQDDFAEKAGRFLDEVFANISDGCLYFVGDFDEETVTGLLCRWLGAFSSSKKFYSKKPGTYPILSGRETDFRQGPDPRILVSMTALTPISMENYLAWRIALKYIEDSLDSKLAPYGLRAEVGGRFDLESAERITAYITVKACAEGSVPADVTPVGMLEGVRVLRTALSEIGEESVSPNRLASCGKFVSGLMAMEAGSCEGLADFILLRYAGGKDLCSQYASRIASIKTDKVETIIKDLVSFTRAEMVIY